MLKDYKNLNHLNSTQPRENKRREVSKDQEGMFMNRRTFLKAAAIIGASFGIGKFATDFIGKEEVENPDNNEKESNDDKAKISEISETQREIELDDKNVIGSTIEEQLRKNEKIVLNSETKNALRKKWKESYAKRPIDCSEKNEEIGKNHLGLLQSMERMQPWISEIKAEFKKIGVPEKFAYLAIPESHFDVNGSSRAMAKGPYQFTKGTAKLFELAVGTVIDERCDPIESARACAKHLKYSYERFNNDWDLAFADYNGGFTNSYAKFRREKKERNYEDYLAWRENRINDYLETDCYKHKVSKDDQNLTKIANSLRVSVLDIMEANEMQDDKIKIGQELKIPTTVSTKIFKLRDSLENLNYPEKFYAVLDVIEEGALEKRFPALSKQFNLIEIPKVETTEFSYKVEKGDGLFAVARKIASTIKKRDPQVNISILQIQGLLQKQNKISNPRKIYIGQALKVRLPLKGGISLNKFARDKGVSVDDLKYLNPAVLDSAEALPVGMKIRIPK